jgi:AraC-like DNA-binding protein
MPLVVCWKKERPQRLRREELARAVQEMVIAAPAARHSLSALAHTLNVSPFHLAHVFRAEMGTSIHQYVLQLRLRLALERLAEGVTSLSALGLDLGFSSHSHFTTSFRKHFGITPREARSVFSKVCTSSEDRAAGLPPAA